MPRGDKAKYTDKQERKADHIAESYEKRGISEKEAERRGLVKLSTIESTLTLLEVVESRRNERVWFSRRGPSAHRCRCGKHLTVADGIGLIFGNPLRR